jgi:hypothetical protein
MTKPLSAWKYYRNHQKKVALVLAIISLSIFLQYALLIYTATMQKFKQGFTYYKSNIYVYTQKSKRSQLQQLLSTNPAISKVFPFSMKLTSIFNGKPIIFIFRSKNMNPALNSLRLALIKGRLPAPGAREIALHWKIAALKGLKVGDHFGYPNSADEYLVGDYRLVGLLDGQLLMGLSGLDADNPKESHSFLVIPRKGQLAKVIRYLNQRVRYDPTLVVVQRNAPVNIENFYLDAFYLEAVYLAIICIVTICSSCLFYIDFYGRRVEYCLLEAMGYTRSMIIRKAFLEITGIVLAGIILGGVICFFSGYALNNWVFMKRGLPLELWDISYPGKLLATPLAIIGGSLLIVRHLLKKIDPIPIIDGEV